MHGRATARARPARCYGRHAYVAALAAAAIMLVVLPDAAPATVVRDRDPVDRGQTKNLTSKERRALDIDRLDVSGSPAGAVVKTTFKGNIDRALGRGHLERGLVAVLLRPKRGRGGASIVATTGTGAKEQTLRRTATRNVVASRDGRTITFLVIGLGYGSVGEIEVKSFARRPAAARAADEGEGKGGLDALGKALADALDENKPADRAKAEVPKATEKCKTLGKSLTTTTDELRDQLKKGQELQKKQIALEQAPFPADPREFEKRQAEIKRLRDEAQGYFNEAGRLTEIGRGLVKDMIKAGCVKLTVTSKGYKHVKPEETFVCAEFMISPAIVTSWMGVEGTLDGQKVTTPLTSFDSSGKVTLTGKVSTLGAHAIGMSAYVSGGEGKLGSGTTVEVTREPPMTKDCPAPK